MFAIDKPEAYYWGQRYDLLKHFLKQGSYGNWSIFGLMSRVVIIAIIMAGCQIQEQPRYIMIGHLADFSREAPPTIIPGNQDHPSIYVVNTDSGLLVLSYMTPSYDVLTRCYYGWEQSTARFVDPCTGAKFTRDGKYIEGPAYRDLDRYSVRVEGDQVLVDFSRLIEGQSVQKPVLDTQSRTYLSELGFDIP